MKKEIYKRDQSTVCIEEEKPNNSYQELTGTSFQALAKDIIKRSAFAIPGYDEDQQTKVLCELLHEMKPQNAVEGMLCAQLAVLHFQGMQCLGSAENADWRPHTEQELNFAVKLLKLQHETIEVLMKYRRKGEQRVVVQHMHVNEGGKAVVGNFQAGGNLSAENGRGTP